MSWCTYAALFEIGMNPVRLNYLSRFLIGATLELSFLAFKFSWPINLNLNRVKLGCLQFFLNLPS